MDQLARDLAKKERRKAVTGGRIKLLNLPRGWLHQAFLYQDWTQRIGWLFLEVMMTTILVLLFHGLARIPLSNMWLWLVALVISHTVNWVLNGNWWAGVLFTFPNLHNPGERVTCDYLNAMAIRLRDNNAVSGVMIFGSVSRGQWHIRSDLDIRLLRRSGFVNGIVGVAVLLREKIIALLARQPLDIYLADGIGFLQKMRKDEPPVFLKKDDPRLENCYPDGDEVRIDKLVQTLSPN